MDQHAESDCSACLLHNAEQIQKDFCTLVCVLSFVSTRVVAQMCFEKHANHHTKKRWNTETASAPVIHVSTCHWKYLNTQRPF
jgi:hypothetical protein